MFSTNLFKSIIIGLSLIASGLIYMSPVYGVDEIEEVLVTGSRIPQKTNLISASPVTEVDADELLYTGAVRIEDLLNDLPQTFANNNSTDSNGAVGTASVDLRGLGRERTLVLVNGKRLVRGSALGGGGGGDLNQIPGILVKKVEVLTGGASAAYGSDAIAGVVNFILDDSFEGVKFDYQFSQYQHSNGNKELQQVVSDFKNATSDTSFDLPASSVSDGDIGAFSFAVGGNFGEEDKGHAVMYAMYREVDPILQADRDYSVCALGSFNTQCIGSNQAIHNTGVTANLVSTLGVSDLAPTPPVDPENLTEAEQAAEDMFNDMYNFYYVVADNSDQFRTRTSADTFNFAPLNYYQRPDKRLVLGGFADYEINQWVESYTEFNYMNDATISQIAPSGAFNLAVDLSCGNPLLSEQQFQAVCGKYGLDKTQHFSDIPVPAPAAGADPAVPILNIRRRNVEGGGRQHDIIHSSYRGVIGFRGDIDTNWSYDVSLNLGRTDVSSIYLNELSKTHIQRALDVTTDEDGNPVCQSVVDKVDPNCVPWNIFINNGNQLVDDVSNGVTQAAIDYISLLLYDRGKTTLRQLNGYVVGDLTEYGVILPTADNGVAISVGYESIEEKLVYRPDAYYQAGDGAGGGGTTIGVSGKLSVDEFFFEARIPIEEDMPFAEALSLDVGIRFADYSTGKTANSNKVALSWAINSGFKVRASQQNAVRHPNIRELFAVQSTGLWGGTDPCANAVGMSPVATLEECMLTGVTAAQFGFIEANTAGQYNALYGGNPDLEPEDSSTLSLGFVYTPDEFPLSLSIDYFDIDLTGAIGGIGAQVILNQCIATENPYFCDLIYRDSTGSLLGTTAYIVDTDINTGYLQRTGFDINADYDLEIEDYGEVNLSLVATYLTTLDSQAIPGAPIDECIGKWGEICGSPKSKLSANVRATWTSHYDVVVSAALRYIGAVEYDAPGEAPDFGAQTYIDLFAIYTRDNLTARLGFNNLFDSEPPLSGYAGPSISGNGNTFPGTYDAFGRFMFLGLGATF